ncbi:MAG: hypothetical protein ACK5MQ_14945 [Pikeienuella sp.]
MRWIGLWAPDWFLDLSVSLIAACFALRRARPATRGSDVFLRRALGRPPLYRELHRHAKSFALTMLDRVSLLTRGGDAFALEARGDEVIRALHAEGRGAVLLGAHYGSFEALRAYDREMPGLVVRYLMHPAHAEASTALLDELNPEVAARVIPLADGRAAMLAVAEALDRGEFVAFLGDRLQEGQGPPRPGAIVEAPFFGACIRLPASPYVASIVARAPLVFCVAVRTGRRRYEIEFTQLHDGSRAPRAARAGLIQSLAEAYAARLERLCRRDPYQWFNFFDIWRA